MGVLKIRTGYEERPYQAELQRRIKRFNVIVCHRRFGKTVWSVNNTIHKGWSCEYRNPQYAYIAPNYQQAKRVAWTMFKDYTSKLPNRTVNEQELRIDMPRAHLGDFIRIHLLGAENPDSLRGMYLDGAILDEYASMNTMVWSEVIRPALSDRRGWACFIGTPKGTNHFKDIYDFAATQNKDWYRVIYRASDTSIYPQEELDAARNEMGDEVYAQEYECDWGAAIKESYYGKEFRKMRESKPSRIGNVPYDRGFQVATAWDLGMDDSTAIWFVQIVGTEVRVIDYYEANGEDLGHYVKIIKEKPYVYDEHLLPHDAGARELGTGVTRQETLRKLGLGRTRIVKKQSPEDGINAVRMLLSRCWFDEVKCSFGIKALENYRRKYDSKNNVYLNKPLHDWSSHGADAFRTYAVGARHTSDRYTVDLQNLPTRTQSRYDIFRRR